ncbi:hypothetical protein BLA29_011009 [Euroglyphus maynei]|uniref:Uncharacterized protein n=1 Tax=Euroglyphus maynei TaxID=6958 RepID=A0A1Y3BB30_EURMA|nr:hypothetical protein BLA29_011009 [Euroglyphus maynei]
MLLSANGSTSIPPSSSSSGISNVAFSTKFKSSEEGFIEPDVKLNPTLTKRSNSDLRKEVLLASIQRSLSASSEDLFTMSKSLNYESSMNEMATDNSDDDPMDIRDRYSDSQQPTSMVMSMSNRSNRHHGCLPSSTIYMPSETQNAYRPHLHPLHRWLDP